MSGLLLQRRELLDRTCDIGLVISASGLAEELIIKYLRKLFGFRDLFVNLLGEILVGLEDLNIRHCGNGAWA